MKNAIFSFVLAGISFCTFGKDIVYVFGSRDEAFLTPGSARFLSSDKIQQFDYSDSMRLLQSVSGVYLQEEDGLGLRPNIGLRGATPHRSKKITLMEDGILIAPAPYSSPAAYFFPNMMRISDLEVYKGTSSVKYGPHSVGGAINFVSRPMPSHRQMELMTSQGVIRKYRFSTSGKAGRFGYLLEYNRMDSDGIKKLPSGVSTGFDKDDFLVKMDYNFEKYGQHLLLKASHVFEQSHETYLGLAPEDFNKEPYSRYAASANDLMEWKHQQYQLFYRVIPSENIIMNMALYYHKFDRNWSKFNGFNNDIHVSNYLNPKSLHYDPHFLNVLRGESDSILDSGEDEIVVGNNQREYDSGGIVLEKSFFWQASKNMYHDISVGFRYHRDRIKRIHIKDIFKMKERKLNASLRNIPSTQNIDTSYARTIFVEDKVGFSNGLMVSLGIRWEEVDTERKSLSGEILSGRPYHNTFAPGLGIQYSPSNNMNFIAGVSKGVSSISPGQDSSVRPEESINYEAGVKYRGLIQGELIGFFNDYKNIKGFCSFSSGCLENNLDQEFNGGEAHIYGLEGRLTSEFEISSFDIPFEINYTKTLARFRKEIESANREWGLGLIRNGDPLPYIPEDKLSLSIGLRRKKVSSFLNYNWQSYVYDQSVQKGRQVVAAQSVVDWTAKYQYSKKFNVFFRLDNVLGREYVVSFRPWGARPGKPRSFHAGMKYVF